MIEVNNVSFEIDGKKILKDINLKIPEGKIYGIIGPNGVGKTTLLRCLTGIYETTNGEVLKMILFGTTGILVLLIVDSMFSNAIMGIICMISILPGALFFMVYRLFTVLDYISWGNDDSLLSKIGDFVGVNLFGGETQ